MARVAFDRRESLVQTFQQGSAGASGGARDLYGDDRMLVYQHTIVVLARALRARGPLRGYLPSRAKSQIVK